MATMKSFTDLEQSKKLAGILPLESADMYYISGDECDICFGRGVYEEIADWICEGTPKPADIPCWSLAALIEVMPSIEGFKPVIDLDINQIRYEGKYRDELCFNSNNLVDACVAMIERLNELKML